MARYTDGLTHARTWAVGNHSGISDTTTPHDSEPVTFAAFGVVVLSNAAGVVLEAGASGDGLGWAYQNSRLESAAGQGNNTAPTSNTAWCYLDLALMAGKTCNLYLAVRPTSLGRLKMVAFEANPDGSDGAFLGLDTYDLPGKMGNQDSEGDYTGSNGVGVGRANSIRNGFTTANYNGSLPNGVSVYRGLPADFDSDTEPSAGGDAVAFDGQGVVAASRLGHVVMTLARLLSPGGIRVEVRAGLGLAEATSEITASGIRIPSRLGRTTALRTAQLAPVGSRVSARVGHGSTTSTISAAIQGVRVHVHTGATSVEVQQALAPRGSRLSTRLGRGGLQQQVRLSIHGLALAARLGRSALVVQRSLDASGLGVTVRCGHCAAQVLQPLHVAGFRLRTELGAGLMSLPEFVPRRVRGQLIAPDSLGLSLHAPGATATLRQTPASGSLGVLIA